MSLLIPVRSASRPRSVHSVKPKDVCCSHVGGDRRLEYVERQCCVCGRDVNMDAKNQDNQKSMKLLVVCLQCVSLSGLIEQPGVDLRSMVLGQGMSVEEGDQLVKELLNPRSHDS